MSSVETFREAIVGIRDILRGPGMFITGMDSMRHICLYMLSRFMTRARVCALGIPERLAWEALLESMRRDEGGRQAALDAFYHDEQDCLMSHFDRLFGTQQFIFDVRDVHKHCEILDMLDAVDMATIDHHMDMLGWVYEQHLQTGSGAARDLGQFFTDRAICDYMTGLCAPGFRSEGVPETVCDPTMGTGGFLTSYIKYFARQHADAPVDWAAQQQQLNGCDSDVKVSSVARMNLFMEMGGRCPDNLKTRDSLYADLPHESYDVILANMPFGTKGIKHASCCERVRELRIRGAKSEPLFLQLMMVALAPQGRCAVVVPEGVLANSTRCHLDTRKHLLQHFELQRVVKMKGGFFMNTTIQPYVLLFRNTGAPTSEVQFWELEKADDGDGVREKCVLKVSMSTIERHGFSLDRRRYEAQVLPVSNPRGYRVMKLEEVCTHRNGAPPKKSETGQYDIMGGGRKYIGKTDSYNRDAACISISKSGSSAGYVMFHDRKFWAGDCMTIVPASPDVKIKFLYYYLKLINKAIMSKSSGTTIPHCKWDVIRSMGIVIPPSNVQGEIVACLESLNSLWHANAARLLNEQVYHRASNLILESVLGRVTATGEMEEGEGAPGAMSVQTSLLSLVNALEQCAHNIKGEMVRMQRLYAQIDNTSASASGDCKSGAESTQKIALA